MVNYLTGSQSVFLGGFWILLIILLSCLAILILDEYPATFFLAAVLVTWKYIYIHI